jgi:hypothetical protein
MYVERVTSNPYDSRKVVVDGLFLLRLALVQFGQNRLPGTRYMDFDHGWMERRAPLLSCIDLLSVVMTCVRSVRTP